MIKQQKFPSVRIAVDQNIPLAAPALKDIGTVHFFDGRKLSNPDLKNIDVLWVRSVTKVDQQLLQNTPIKFVGTATAGINHLDQKYLAQNHIKWVSAPGSNAYSVSDYICSHIALLIKDNFLKSDAKIGILGHGHVGQIVARRLKALGFQVKVYDPIMQELYGDKDLAPLEDLYDSDLLTLHIPLTSNGKYPTHRWINKSFIHKFKPELILINASRGEVLAENEILDLRQNGYIKKLIMDVFENEPKVQDRVFEVADYVSPHIAGYSWTGKIRGTQMLRNELLKFLNLPLSPFPVDRPVLKLVDQDIWSQFLEIYDPRVDDHNFRELRKQQLIEQIFDHLRKNYPVRYEWTDYN